MRTYCWLAALKKSPSGSSKHLWSVWSKTMYWEVKSALFGLALDRLMRASLVGCWQPSKLNRRFETYLISLLFWNDFWLKTMYWEVLKSALYGPDDSWEIVYMAVGSLEKSQGVSTIRLLKNAKTSENGSIMCINFGRSHRIAIVQNLVSYLRFEVIFWWVCGDVKGCVAKDGRTSLWALFFYCFLGTKSTNFLLVFLVCCS